MERGRMTREPAVENAEMPVEETISQFGDVPRKERAVAVEVRTDDESGSFATERAYLARDPRFMEGVKEVRQLDAKRLRWVASIAGKEEEWDAEITEQTPDQRVAWRSTSGAKNAGVVTFHYLDETKARVMLQLEYEPEGVVE